MRSEHLPGIGFFRCLKKGIKFLVGRKGVSKLLSTFYRLESCWSNMKVTLLTFVCRFSYCQKSFFSQYELFQFRKKPCPGVHLSASYSVKGKGRPHVLFITEKWCDTNPSFGLTNSVHNFFGSLEATGLATQEHFHYDEYYYLFHRRGEAALMARCLKGGIDVVVLTWTIGSPYNICSAVIKKIKEAGIFVVAIWFDSVHPWCQQVMKKIGRLVDLNIPIDSSSAWQKAGLSEKSVLPMWTPQDPRVFFDPRLPRDIPVSFLGSLSGRPERLQALRALNAAGITVFQAGGQRERPLAIEDYARILMRSKMTLNFSNPEPCCQLKGRVFEATLCGCLLVESENLETCKYLKPMVDYISFKEERDLIEKVCYYLSHEEEREAIARNGHRKVVSKYNAEVFWRTVLAVIDSKRVEKNGKPGEKTGC